LNCSVTRFSCSSATPTGSTMSAKSRRGAGRGRDPRPLARVEQVLHEHHRVIALLDRLAVEEVAQPREGLGVVVGRDRDVLLRRGELVPDLLVEQVDESRGGHVAVP
jgi:hypothetical protein